MLNKLLYHCYSMIPVLDPRPVTVNVELFEKIADHIERYPHEYNQRSARECIFGIACMLSGIELLAHDKPLCFVGATRTDDGSAGWLPNVLEGRMFSVGYHLLKLSSPHDGFRLCSAFWKPAKGLTVPQTLRLIAKGLSVNTVTGTR